MRPYGWLGLLLLLLSEYCLFRRIEPFHTWFYCFAWWSYILMADNLLLKLRGRSLLFSRPGAFWRMLLFSVFTWLCFEAYNLVLGNWAYQGVPAELWLRWSGYAAAFATVIPGIFITADILEHFLFRDGGKTSASQIDSLQSPPAATSAPVFLGIGLVLSIAPLFWPRYFFPAVWLGPIFLLDPLLGRMGLRNLEEQVAARDWRRICSLPAAGLACGLMWEFWNFWAPSRWVYDVPFVGGWKVFEMPILGFLGFPPFALECWILYHLLESLHHRLGPAARVVYWISIAVFCAIVFHALDQQTVLSFR